jgi:hypothetical protein
MRQYRPVCGHIWFHSTPFQCHSCNVQYKHLLPSMSMYWHVSVAEPCSFRRTPWSITCNTPTWEYRLLLACIHSYRLVSDRVLSSFRTSTESITESTWVYIDTAQYCAVIICTTPELTLHWVHTRLHILFIALIAFVAPVTVQHWCVWININILTGFIQFSLTLWPEQIKIFP